MNKDLETCLWYELGKNENSTSFKGADSKESRLYDCKYLCDGKNVSCGGYIKQSQYTDRK